MLWFEYHFNLLGFFSLLNWCVELILPLCCCKRGTDSLVKASDVFTFFLQVCKYVLIGAGVRGAEHSGRQELAGSSGEVRNKLLLKVTLRGGLAPAQPRAHLQVHTAPRSVRRSLRKECADGDSQQKAETITSPTQTSEHCKEWERHALSLGSP